MKDKEKQIEEMAKDLDDCVSYDEWCAREYGEYTVDCSYTAYKLIEKGWIKPNEDSVVLSKEEWECLHNDYAKALYNARQNEHKETAEKIANEIKAYIYDNDNLVEIVNKIAKQFGVDIKE